MPAWLWREAFRVGTAPLEHYDHGGYRRSVGAVSRRDVCANRMSQVTSVRISIATKETRKLVRESQRWVQCNERSGPSGLSIQFVLDGIDAAM